MEDIRAIVEEINSLTEDEFVDEFVDAEISDAVLEEPAQHSATEELDAKTKISRALDVLCDAIEDFKNTTAGEIDLVTNADLNLTIEGLDGKINEIRSALNGEAPVADIVPEVEDQLPALTDDIIDSDEELGEEDEENIDSDIEEIVFDDEAELDLFPEEE
jgi:hypothetical protein